ncbi:putative zinc-binding protein [bacterium]|nr:putative zinc-binding protein [bacterium]
MADEKLRVGIISCSGEEIPEGTISRLATRRVLEMLRPDQTVTLCLPLFLAGNEQERDFARNHPIVTVDGCDKRCAQFGTEKHSGPVSAALVVTDMLKGGYPSCVRNSRQRGEADREAVWVVAETIAAAVDQVLEEAGGAGECGDDAAACACSRPMPGGKVTVNGEEVTIPGLQMIFRHLVETGVAAEPKNAARILETVGIYHPIPGGDREAYQEALVAAYQEYCVKVAQ